MADSYRGSRGDHIRYVSISVPRSASAGARRFGVRGPASVLSPGALVLVERRRGPPCPEILGRRLRYFPDTRHAVHLIAPDDRVPVFADPTVRFLTVADRACVVGPEALFAGLSTIDVDCRSGEIRSVVLGLPVSSDLVRLPPGFLALWALDEPEEPEGPDDPDLQD